MSEPILSTLGRRRQPGDAVVLHDGGAAQVPTVQTYGQRSNEPLLRISWTRALAALRRYKWFAALIVVAGTGVGVMLTRMAAPEYEVHGTIWISNDGANTGERNVGPIRAGEVMRQTSWPDLLASFAILDKVVRRTSLNLSPARPSDSAAFAGFDTDEKFRPGTYELKVAESGWQYKLLDQSGDPVASGIVGDSIGRTLGFRWKPAAAALPRGRSMKFSVVTPREAAMQLRDNLDITLPLESSLLQVTLKGVDAHRITNVMNALLDEFVNAAANLKKRSVSEAGKALAQQVDYAGRQLQAAEGALEAFRVQTITLPSENASATNGGGAERSRDPVFESFFAQKIAADNVRRDRQTLQSILAGIQQRQLDPSALWSVPLVQSSPAPELKAALSDLAAKQSALRAAERTYTDDHKVVRDMRADVEELRSQTIPRLASALVAEQQRREAALDAQVQGTAEQLRSIPVRTTEETRLRRDVEARGTLYTTLKNKFEEATLAEASMVPDVSILDAPAVPQQPRQNRAPIIILMSALVSLAVAVSVALLLDQLDRRFRYAEQATQEMGLDVIGVVPALTQTKPELRDPLEAAHAREAFRSIRLGVMHAFDATERPVVTISSPGAGDGKSLLSSNLALSFADANCRTLLIDGDIRRGELHTKFDVERLPGFVDYLAGGYTLDKVLRKTGHERLTLLPRGASQLHGPELLLSPAMSALMDDVQQKYDVIIIDSPPLSAGIDPFVLGTATGTLLLVLRSGETDRRLAQAKLKVLNRLPVRLLGAVLNATPAEGDYRYYSYLYTDLKDDVTPPAPDTRDRTDAVVPLVAHAEVPVVSTSTPPPPPAPAA